MCVIYLSDLSVCSVRVLFCAILQNCFDALPLCAVVQSKIFVVHGGLFARDGVTLSHLRAVQRKREPPLHNPSFEDQVFEDMLWSDPRPILVKNKAQRETMMYIYV